MRREIKAPVFLSAFRRQVVLLTSATFLPAALAFSQEEKGEAETKRPPLEKLVQLNGAKIFGGRTELKKDRVIVRYTKSPEFRGGFDGTNFETPDDLKGPNRDLLKKPKDGNVKDPVGVGRGDGQWTSKFELHDDFKIDFKLTCPRIFKNSQINFLINQSRRSYVLATNFAMATLVENGSPKKRKITPERKFTTSPDRWYDRKGAEFPVSIRYSKGTFELSYNKQKLLTLDGADNVSSGRIGLQFKNVSFIISEMRIDAKLNRTWCEERLAALERTGELVTKEPTSRTKKKKKKNDAAAREKQKKEEAEIEL